MLFLQEISYAWVSQWWLSVFMNLSYEFRLPLSQMLSFRLLWFLTKQFQKQQYSNKNIFGILLSISGWVIRQQQEETAARHTARFNAAKFNLNDINDDDTCDWHLPWSVSLIVWKMSLRFHSNHRFNLEMNFKTQPQIRQTI